jgi:hypothetical protein
VEPDWVARGIAIGGAAAALGSLGWQVFSWRRSGQVVKVRAWCTGRGAEMTLTGTLVSAGRADARVVRASLSWPAWADGGTYGNSSRMVACKLPAEHLDGIDFPLPMPSQTDYEFAVKDLQGVDPGLWHALHERRAVKLVFHTPTGKGSTTIKYRNPPSR